MSLCATITRPPLDAPRSPVSFAWARPEDTYSLVNNILQSGIAGRKDWELPET
jgi:hypothetical protein